MVILLFILICSTRSSTLKNCSRQPLEPLGRTYFIRHKIAHQLNYVLFQAIDVRGKNIVVLKQHLSQTSDWMFCLQRRLANTSISEPYFKTYLDIKNNFTISIYNSTQSIEMRQLEVRGFLPLQFQYVVYRLLQKLHLLHQLHFYHGNIDHSTILFRQQPTRDVFLSDFRLAGQSSDDFKHNFEKRKIMPPEIQQNQCIGTYSDIWQLGSLIKQILLVPLAQTQINSQLTGTKTQVNRFIEKDNLQRYENWLPLLNEMLNENVKKRITAQQAIKNTVFQPLFSLKMFRIETNRILTTH